MADFTAGWYLIYTKPKHEKKVHIRLSEMKLTTFLPTRKALRHWHDRKRFIDEPLFPSYVFIYLNDIRNYYDGIDTDGALYYVKTGKKIARVDDVIVGNIKLVQEAKNIEISEDRFLPGRKLVIGQGALTGLACEVVEFRNEQRLLVRVELLQRNILLTLPSNHLIAS